MTKLSQLVGISSKPLPLLGRVDIDVYGRFLIHRPCSAGLVKAKISLAIKEKDGRFEHVSFCKGCSTKVGKDLHRKLLLIHGYTINPLGYRGPLLSFGMVPFLSCFSEAPDLPKDFQKIYFKGAEKVELEMIFWNRTPAKLTNDGTIPI